MNTTEVVSDNRFNEIKGDTRDIAAKQVGVGESSVQRALEVKKESPKEFERVKSVEITVGAVHRVLNGDTSTKRKSHGKNPLTTPRAVAESLQLLYKEGTPKAIYP